MTAPTDPRAREREALEAAHGACPCRENTLEAMKRCSPDSGDKPMCRCFHDATCAAGPSPSDECPDADGWMGCDWPGHAAIDAYGRAVREADKEAIKSVQDLLNACDSFREREYGAQDALTSVRAAIEALEEKP